MAVEHSYQIDWVNDGGTTTQLTQVMEFEVVQSIGIRTDTFSIRLPDRAVAGGQSRIFDEFKLQNQIRIYASNSGSLNTASDILIDGEIVDKSHEYDENGHFIRLNGQNRTGRILSKQVAASITSSNLTTSIFTRFIAAVNTDLASLGKDQITWAGDNATSSVTLTNYMTNFKPVIDHIDTLSNDEYTSDGTKIFWLDENNAFHWKDRPTAISGSLTEGSQILNIKATLDVFDVINFAIINAGKDDTTTSVVTYVHNAASIADLGFRSEFILDEEIANKLRQNTTLTGSDLRDKIIETAKQKWKDKLAKPKWKAVTELQGTQDFARGLKYRIFSNTLGAPFTTGKELTLEEVRHTFGRDGWITRLELKEEELDIDNTGIGS